MGMKDKAAEASRRLRNPGTHALRKRVAELEAEVQECRQLNLRVAELTDIVTELLVPLARGDKDELEATLAKYHESL